MAALGSSPVLWLTTLVVSLVAGLVPVVNLEVYLIAVSAVAPDSALAPLAFVAALGQMAAKSLLYLAGQGALRLPLGGLRPRVEAMRSRYGSSRGGLVVVLASAFFGVPPFYGVSVLAGALRWRFDRFLVAGFLGRLARFGAVLLLPRVLAA